MLKAVRGGRVAGLLAMLGSAAVACSSERQCRGPGGVCIPEPVFESVSSGGDEGGEGGGGGNFGSDGGLMSGGGRTSEGGLPGHDDSWSFAGESGFAGPGFNPPEVPTDGDGGAGGVPPSPEPIGPNYCDDLEALQLPLDLLVTSYFDISLWTDDNVDWNSFHELALVAPPDRAPGAQGQPVGLRWIPTTLPSVGADLLSFFRCIEAGAEGVRFQARADRNGATANFGVVGAALDGQALTTAWTTFEIPLNGLDYNHYSAPGGVSVGLSVELTNPALGEQRVYIDDIRWVGPSSPKCTPPLTLPAVCADTSSGGVAAASAIRAAVDCPISTGAASAPGEGRRLLDDFEDGDALALPIPEANAHWQTLNDGSARAVQYPGKCAAPTYDASSLDNQWSLRTYGCGFSLSGAGVGLVFDGDTPGCLPLLRNYDGIEFTLSGLNINLITLEIRAVATTPVSEGGTCTANCLPPPVFPSTSGSAMRVRFADLGPYFDPATILAIGWMLRPPYLPESFDFTIDNVALYKNDSF